jgi:golgin subfamily B member 1
LFPDVEELESLFLAALLLGNPALPVAEHLKARVRPLGEALAPLLEARQLDELRRQFKVFAAGGGRTNLLAWGEAVDKTAARAGLLLCDDLPTAVKLLEREEGARGPLLSDLLGFSASAQYSALRRHLGIAIG